MLTRGANLESIARALTDRERHLDMWRQLRREPSHVPRRIAGSQLVESIDEKNQRLLRSRHRKPFPERVFEFRVIDWSLTGCNVPAEAGKERMAARRDPGPPWNGPIGRASCRGRG